MRIYTNNSQGKEFQVKSRLYNLLSFTFVFISVFSLSYTFLTAQGITGKINLLGFFTIQSNIIILAIVILKIYDISFPRKWEMAAAAAIIITALVFQTLLRRQASFNGLSGLNMNIEHGVTTVLFLLWFWLAPEKKPVQFREILYVLPYPALYCIFGVTEGLIKGKYRYFFLNVKALGWPGLAVWIAVLGVMFLLTGAFVIGIDKILEKKKNII